VVNLPKSGTGASAATDPARNADSVREFSYHDMIKKTGHDTGARQFQ
jgi:hypothetical protein